jgi:hypothetical protein
VAFSGFDAYVSKMGARGLADVGEKGRKEGEAIAGIVIDKGKVLFAADQCHLEPEYGHP